MPQTINYEIVGKFIRVIIEGESVTFHPINPEIQSYIFNDDPYVGMKIGGLEIRDMTRFGPNYPPIDVKPSYEEFKNNIMKMIGVSASGGRKVTKTRRRVRIV